MSTVNQFQLLSKRRFLPYFITQFLGAFNDNIFKNALIIYIAFQVHQFYGLSSNTLINACAGLFILPFFLFSALAGELADKYEKSHLIRLIKLAEIMIALLVSIGFMMDNILVLMGALFLLGTQSSFFGPIKYSLLPLYLDNSEIVGGNGLVEMGTFLAILFGTITGGILIGLPHYASASVAVAVILVAMIGFVACLYIPKRSAANPNLTLNKNLFIQTWRTMRYAHVNHTVFVAILGISWFWFVGALYLTQFPNFTKFVLGGSEQVVTLLLAIFSIGIGVGSLLCERLSQHRIETGLITLGALGVTLFSIILFAASHVFVAGDHLNAWAFLALPHSWTISLSICLIGMFGGFFIVPLYVVIQTRSAPEQRSQVIAANNILNALFMVGAAILAPVLLYLGVTIPVLFLLVGCGTLVVAVISFYQVPEFALRFFVWILVNCLYRMRSIDEDNIPEKGAAILISNHVSFVDAAFIMAKVKRPVRFVMYYKIFNKPFFSYLFKLANVIPVASKSEDPEILQQCYNSVQHSLEQGKLVCIFPEGRITHDGNIHTFKPGVLKILKQTPVPVVPMALQNVWGSLFSRKRSKFKRLWPAKFFAKITLVVGKPIPPEQVSLEKLQKEVETSYEKQLSTTTT